MYVCITSKLTQYFSIKGDKYWANSRGRKPSTLHLEDPESAERTWIQTNKMPFFIREINLEPEINKLKRRRLTLIALGSLTLWGSGRREMFAPTCNSFSWLKNLRPTIKVWRVTPDTFSIVVTSTLLWDGDGDGDGVVSYSWFMMWVWAWPQQSSLYLFVKSDWWILLDFLDKKKKFESRRVRWLNFRLVPGRVSLSDKHVSGDEEEN